MVEAAAVSNGDIVGQFEQRRGRHYPLGRIGPQRATVVADPVTHRDTAYALANFDDCSGPFHANPQGGWTG
jgi:hypothetical protein